LDHIFGQPIEGIEKPNKNKFNWECEFWHSPFPHFAVNIAKLDRPKISRELLRMTFPQQFKYF
jgi:hypothetical protein